MHIVIILGPFLPVPPVLGGATEKVHLLLASAYRAAGHDVTIVSRRYRDFPREELIDGVRHIRIPSFGRSPWLILNLARDLCYSIYASFAQPQGDVTITNGFFLPLVLRRRKSGNIYVQVGRYPKYQMCLYFRAGRLQAVSRAVADAIVRQAPWLAPKVSVIGCAVSDAYFDSNEMPQRGKTILFVGRIAREKGISILLKAIISLQRHNADHDFNHWKLRIIGPHDVSQGGDGIEYLRELKSLARPLGSRCEFAGPIFDEGTLIREYQSAAIFVYPSLAERGESLGLAPLEAMAAKCSVVVSDLRCFDDYVVDGVTGLKFDHRVESPEENLASRLACLIVNPGLRERLAGAGHYVARQFRTRAIATRMLDDFATLVTHQQR